MLSTAWDVDILVCDGIFGPKTAGYIKKWKKSFRSEIKVDGKIDAVDGKKLRSTVSNTIYTMLAINAEFSKYLPLTYDNIKIDPRLRPELRSVLLLKTTGKKIIGMPQALIN